MNMNEYMQVKDMSYFDYCKHLKDKYGEAPLDYMTPSYVKNKGVRRTNEGLYVHHIMEYIAYRLSGILEAREYPYEYQLKENLVYCDYLEHLLLHLMIFRETKELGFRAHGYMGMIYYMLPELNNWFLGEGPQQAWQKRIFRKISGDKDVYLEIVKELLSLGADNLNIISFEEKNQEQLQKIGLDITIPDIGKFLESEGKSPQKTSLYVVIGIGNDYVQLKSIGKEPDIIKSVAKVLLPEEIREGSRLKYEMLSYTLED